MKDKDLDHLKDYVKRSASSRQTFLKLGDGGGEEADDVSGMDEDPEMLAQEEAEEVSKKRRVDLGTAITDLYAKEVTVLSGLLASTKSAIDTCKAAVNQSVQSGLMESDDALSQFHSTCMIRLRGMVAWLATEATQVPSEQTSLEELERIMSHPHPHFPVVVEEGGTFTADKVEGESRRNASPKQNATHNQVAQQHMQSIPNIQSTLNSKHIPSIPSNT